MTNMKSYDLTKQLLERNQKATVILDESHFYLVNNSYKTVILMQAIAEDMEDEKDPEALVNSMYKLIEQVIGKDGADYVRSLDLSVDAMNYLVSQLMDAVKGGDDAKN